MLLRRTENDVLVIPVLEQEESKEKEDRIENLLIQSVNFMITSM